MRTSPRLPAVLALAAAVALGGVTAHAAATPATGEAPAARATQGIIGGCQADEGAWPMAAKLRTHDASGVYGCGATLISPDVVLTAQHCLDQPPSAEFTAEVYIGKVDWKQGEHHALTAWATGAGPRKGDWAVAKLDTPATTGTYATLPTDDSLDGASTFDAIGWGRTNEYEPASSPLLQEVRLDAAKPGACSRTAHSELCTGGNGVAGKDTCTGDSGGPLFATGPDGRRVQVGITSWGVGCGRAQFEGHSTKVSAFTNDILAAIDSIGGTRPGAAPTSEPTSGPTAEPTSEPTAEPTTAGVRPRRA